MGLHPRPVTIDVDALAEALHARYCVSRCGFPVVLHEPWQPTGWQDWAAVLLEDAGDATIPELVDRAEHR